MSLEKEDLQAVQGLIQPIYTRLDAIESRMDSFEDRMDGFESRMQNIEECLQKIHCSQVRFELEFGPKLDVALEGLHSKNMREMQIDRLESTQEEHERRIRSLEQAVNKQQEKKG